MKTIHGVVILTFLWFLISCGQSSVKNGVASVGKSGVEVRGGTRIVIDIRRVDSHLLTESEQARSREALIRSWANWRQWGLDLVEHKVRAGDANQIVIEIFGEFDRDSMLEFIGSGARMQVYHAINLTTTLRERRFLLGKVVSEDSGPAVWFLIRGSDSDPIMPDTEEYRDLIDDWVLIAAGEDLVEALPLTRSDGSVVPQLILNQVGANKMERWSRAVLNQSELLAIVVDGVVLSVTPMKSATVLKDRIVIEGKFDEEQVQLLTDELNVGWDADISIVEEKVFPVPDVNE